LWGGVHTGSTRHVGHFWSIVPAPGGCEDGEFDGMKIGRGNHQFYKILVPLVRGEFFYLILNQYKYFKYKMVGHELALNNTNAV
jgi:hypothetical protein